MLDATDDFLDRHTPGLRHLAAERVEGVLQRLRHRRRAVHHQMRIGQPAMDFLHHPHRQNVAVRLAREFIRAVRCTHRNRQRIDPGGANEIDGLVRIGQQLIVADLAFDAVAVLLLAAAMLERAEHAQLAFDRGADPVRHVDHPASDIDVVFVACRGLGIGLQRTVHHHGGEAVLKRGGAGRFLVAVVLVQAERDLRMHLLQRVDHLRQHDVVGIGARAPRGLDDHGRVDCRRRIHDREPLLHIVDVECRHTVSVLGGMIQQLPQGNSCHPGLRVIDRRIGVKRKSPPSASARYSAARPSLPHRR